MRYLVTLKPLEPFMFGGDQTFGALGDKESGSYLVKSRMFPQQTALLGMLKKVLMTQEGLLTRKRRGEWVDKQKRDETNKLVGEAKFNMLETKVQNFGNIKYISPIFLRKDNKRYMKKVNIDAYPYCDGKLENFNGKIDIYDNFIAMDGGKDYKKDDIFKAVEQTGNKKGGEENSLFKKTTYLLKEMFTFAFYVDLECELKSEMVTLGADRSAFMMTVEEDNTPLNYTDKKGYLTLLSDTYININIKDNCEFAITSELSHKNLKSKKSAIVSHKFEKSETLYLYEKGSVFIKPTEALIAALKQPNLQQIGYNTYTTGDK